MVLPVTSRRSFVAASLALGADALATKRAARAAPALIDSHVHVWKVSPKYPFATSSKNPPTEDATAQMLLGLMKAHGVQKSVIVQVSHYGWDHRYLAGVLRRHKGRFVGVARVNPEDPAAPDQLEALVKKRGFRGLRLNVQPDPAYDWVRGPLMPPLWQRCQDLRVPLGLQTKHSRLPDLGKLVEKFPELTVVVDHMADTPADDTKALDNLLGWQRYPNVFVKITHAWWVSKKPYPYEDALAMVKRIYDRFGPRRLLWGTDWPIVNRFCGYTKALELVRDEMPFLNDEDKAWIFEKTARHVWRL